MIIQVFAAIAAIINNILSIITQSKKMKAEEKFAQIEATVEAKSAELKVLEARRIVLDVEQSKVSDLSLEEAADYWNKKS